LRPAFLTLLAAVSAVLLIAQQCRELAASARSRDASARIALRMALGAERHGIVRLFVFESTLVSVIAGMIDWVWRSDGIGRSEIGWSKRSTRKRSKLQSPVLIFTLGLSLITGLPMGLYPAWQSSRADLVGWA
jgi:ABC-type lipoprotein release transport system permease subunit